MLGMWAYWMKKEREPDAAKDFFLFLRAFSESCNLLVYRYRKQTYLVGPLSICCVSRTESVCL